MTDIVTLTLNPCIDQIAEVDRVEHGKKLRMSDPRFEPGGGGVNVARAIHSLGGEAAAVHTAGGPHGDLLAQRLQEAGIEHEAIRIDGMTRLNPNIFEEGGDAAYRFVMPGPTLENDVVQQCIDAALDRQPAWLVASGSLPGDTDDQTYATLAERAARADVRLVLDASGPALQRAVERGVDVLKPNLRELGELTGDELSGEQAIRDAAQSLVDRGGARVVLVSMGKGGALLVSDDVNRRLHSPTVPVRSRIGAGDSTVAGLVLALSRGRSLADAARFAVAAGAAAVTRPGTQLCDRSTTESLDEQMRSAS